MLYVNNLYIVVVLRECKLARPFLYVVAHRLNSTMSTQHLSRETLDSSDTQHTVSQTFIEQTVCNATKRNLNNFEWMC